jgi:cytochrome c peroxidase
LRHSVSPSCVLVGLLGLFGAAALGGCKEQPSQDQKKAEPAAKPAGETMAVRPTTVDPADLAFFKPLPDRFETSKNPITEAKVKLGRVLYYETRLSRNQQLSCNSCHGLDTYGVDNQPTSLGHKGQRGRRNSPTVYNAAGHIAQFWDGRAATVEDQAKGPILNPVEMAMPSEAAVITVIKSIPDYDGMFKAAFPGDKDPITYDNLANAIGAFERQLVTPGRWDKFLNGDPMALTEPEKAGFLMFTKTGCQTCHAGPSLGGAQFQKLGAVNPYPDQSDQGRYEVTKNDIDKMMFRVPTLRNVAKTGPYFHDGKVATLEEAVKSMAHFQLGKELSDADTGSIVTFLKSLTGELPTAYIRPPVLPQGSAKTPKAKLD